MTTHKVSRTTERSVAKPPTTSLFMVAGLVLFLSGCGSNENQGDPDQGTISSDGSPSPDGEAAGCGNEVMEPAEQCDGQDLYGMTCEALGYSGGSLGCTEQCELDPSGCEGTPTGRQFGQTCSETIGECVEGLECMKPSPNTDVGFCTAECSETAPCPTVPRGAQCIFQISGGKKVCGFLCDESKPICPLDLACISSPQASYCSTEQPPANCGDDKVDGTEECDGADLGGQTCQTLGFVSGGTLKCVSSSCTFDTSGCTGAPSAGDFGSLCGGSLPQCKQGLFCLLVNSTGADKGYCSQTCNATLYCPTSPPGAECIYKLPSGTTACGIRCDALNPKCPAGLACTKQSSGFYACTADPLPVCGNNEIEGLEEECDGTDLDNMSCAAFGFASGTLKCTNCKFDQSGCTKSTSCSLPPMTCTAGQVACHALELFPESADGVERYNPPEWSYLRHHTVMLVKYAAAAVHCLMPGNYPIKTFDMSDASGNIPTQDGQIRHPLGSHEEGKDIDLAYYQTQGMDYPGEVCPHMLNGADDNRCVSPPTILDAPRVTLFVGKLLESQLIRAIGVDGMIAPIIGTEAQKLLQQGLITNSAYNNLGKIAFETTDTGAGWYRSHHHHMHVSTLDVIYPSPMMPDGDEDTEPWLEAAPGYGEQRWLSLCGSANADQRIPELRQSAFDPYRETPLILVKVHALAGWRLNRSAADGLQMMHPAAQNLP